ncbi:MAG TPA: helix-turn-helix domain-containing protein [Flavisolibacter sp.]|nr:helix-turn-helix domain-containing protein [Flavisolibacter sp.]
MTKPSYNIKEIRQLYNLTQQEFAAALGITRELVNKIEKGKSSVSRATAALVQQFLRERQSENFSLSGNEVDILGVASPFSRPEPYHLQRREQKNRSAALLVPLVGIKAQAGYVKGFEHADYIDSLDKFSLPPGVNPMGAVWSYFEVDGESMEPSLHAGDVILASMLPHEDWNDIKNFCVYVILTSEQLLVKRVFRQNDRQWILISDNEETNPQVVMPVENIRQVWTFRRHIRSRLPAPKVFEVRASS